MRLVKLEDWEAIMIAFAMGDRKRDDRNRIGFGAIMDRYRYGLIAFALGVSLALEWYLLFLVICIHAWIVIRNGRMSSRREELRAAMESFPWVALHQLVRDSLEMVKCRRMIERGYGSRANTNIILQEQKQQPAAFDLTQAEAQAIAVIVAISESMHRLREVKRRLFGQQQLSDEGEPTCKIGCFRELFMVGRETDKLIQEISSLPLLFKARMKQPLLNPSSRNKLVDQCKRRVLPLLSQLSMHYHNLGDIIAEEMKALKLNSQCQQYFDALASESYHEDQLQSLMIKVEHLSGKAIKNPQIPIEGNYTSELSEGNQQISREIPLQTRTQQPSELQRRQFMKKLDALLMKGLARRRQEQFQRRLKLLEEQPPAQA